MKKVLLFVLLLIPVNVFALEMPDINSKNAIIYDLTSDEVISKKNSEEEASIASLTKIMTVITAIENINNLDESVTITSNMLKGIYWNASRAGLKVGDIVTYRDLLYAAMLPSGADATQALAYAISGNVPDFVNKMNELAIKINMNNSHFVNTTGLDAKEHYSTVEDLLKLLKYALDNPIFKEVYTTREYTLTNGLKLESTISKYNEKLALDTSRIIGSKTGNTASAGLCMSALFQKEEHEILVITLKGEKIEDNLYNIIDTLDIIEYIDNNYEIIEEAPVVAVPENNFNIKEIEVYHFEYIIPLIIIFLFIVLMCTKSNKRKTRRKK